MPRKPRATPGRYIYHAMNQAVARLPMFKKQADFEMFLDVLDAAIVKHPMRVLGYCVMPDHWRIVLWPRQEGEISDFLRWLTHTHTMRWHAAHQTIGSGHLYRGRFKSFPVQADEHLHNVMRFVEASPLREGLVEQAEDWQWSSLHHRATGLDSTDRLAPWPVPIRRDWVRWVNKPGTKAELAALEVAMNRGQPYGTEAWQKSTAKKLGLESSLRPRGRPRIHKASGAP